MKAPYLHVDSFEKDAGPTKGALLCPLPSLGAGFFLSRHDNTQIVDIKSERALRKKNPSERCPFA